MFDATNIQNSATLARSITADALTLSVPAGMGSLFTVRSGTHYYATIRANGFFERVRVSSRSGDVLSIQRGVDGTTARDWPAGACIAVEWTPAALCEFVQQCNGGVAPASTVNPGQYCLSGCTCITVDAAGRITNIETKGS